MRLEHKPSWLGRMWQGMVDATVRTIDHGLQVGGDFIRGTSTRPETSEEVAPPRAKKLKQLNQGRARAEPAAVEYSPDVGNQGYNRQRERSWEEVRAEREQKFHERDEARRAREQQHERYREFTRSR